MKCSRRKFLGVSGLGVAGLAFQDPIQFRSNDTKTKIGLVQSSHSRLARPSSIEDPLDYPKVRDMVWKAIEYGKSRTGSLGAKIHPGSWVAIKPNICFLPPQHDDYTTGDPTDFRVTQAVLEYVATHTQAGRITIAEGGSYRALHDPSTLMAVTQNGQRVDATTYDWGDKEFPGWGGTMGEMLRESSARFPTKKFDYVDLSYDAVRDASGAFVFTEVQKTAGGVGAFAARSHYCLTKAIRDCDFLIDVPVMKVHSECGITACMKNYVGTAPREVYAPPYRFSNRILHDVYTVEGRVDGFIADLVSFRPPDFNVVDGIRGLQYANHKNGQPDQLLQNNVILAGEDPVALDALVARLLGFNPWDIDYLHMANMREIGTMSLAEVEVVGDDPDRVARRWGKPRRWHGRGNREWLVTRDPSAPLATWKRYVARTDTLKLADAAGDAPPGTTYGAAVRVHATGHIKAYLWVGVRGRAEAILNGQKVMEEENTTRYRVGQFQAPVELRPGENLLSLRVQASAEAPQVSAILVGPRNDGDTAEGIRWSA